MRKLLTAAAALALLGLALLGLADRNVRAQIYALPQAAACLVTPGSTTAGWVVSWGSTNGCTLATGYAVGNSGANTVLETDSGGKVNRSVVPMPFDTSATGHFEYAGTTPTLQANCGTGAVISGNDVMGRITLGTSPGGYCGVNFAAGWVNTPVCAVSNETTGTRGVFPQPSTTQLAIVATSGSLTASDSLTYFCAGYR